MVSPTVGPGMTDAILRNKQWKTPKWVFALKCPGCPHRDTLMVGIALNEFLYQWYYYVCWSDVMRCCRSDWPGLCLFCCSQPSCAVANRADFGLFFISKISDSPPPPQPSWLWDFFVSQIFHLYSPRRRLGNACVHDGNDSVRTRSTNHWENRILAATAKGNRHGILPWARQVGQVHGFHSGSGFITFEFSFFYCTVAFFSSHFHIL